MYCLYCLKKYGFYIYKYKIMFLTYFINSILLFKLLNVNHISFLLTLVDNIICL